MKKALEQAKIAMEQEEVPIGAVIEYNGEIIASAYNEREMRQQASAHAELLVIEKACTLLKTWRLENCTLYVTLEPCPMCAGAIIQSRIERVVYGANDPKAGCAGTLMNLLNDDRFNHQTEVIPQILEKECSQLLSTFFKNLRNRKKRK